MDARDNLEESPLHFAAREGHVAACELLLAAGADVAATTRFGVTPRQRTESESVAALLERSR